MNTFYARLYQIKQSHDTTSKIIKCYTIDPKAVRVSTCIYFFNSYWVKYAVIIYDQVIFDYSMQRKYRFYTQ